jgi:hypothetical protein
MLQGGFKRLSTWSWLIVLFLLGMIVVGLVVWFLPSTITAHDNSGLRVTNALELLKERNAVRTTLLQGLAGAFLFASAVAAWRQVSIASEQAREAEAANREQRDLARRSHLSERLRQAITLLGDDSADVRVGGVFELGGWMDEAGETAPLPPRSERGPREDGIDILSAFVRKHATPERHDEERPPLHNGQVPREATDLRVRAAHVQAALWVIGRRPRWTDDELREISHLLSTDEVSAEYDFDLKAWTKNIEVSMHNVFLDNAALSDLNLTLVRFDDAILSHASIRRADLRCSRLKRADLRRAHLRRAKLSWTNLVRADLTEARMEGADLSSAIIRGATFTGATLRSVRFDGVDLTDAAFDGADLRGADFSGATNFARARCWQHARVNDETTRWPNGEQRPAGTIVA